MSKYKNITIACILFFIFIRCSAIFAGDGEGTAKILSPEKLVAGSLERVVVEVKVGTNGIPKGGGVALCLHHAAEWRGLQIGSANKKGFMTVNCDTPKNLKISWHSWAPKGTFANNRQSMLEDGIFHQAFIAKVKNKALKPGEKVKFVIGANKHKTVVPRSVDKNHEFRIVTDVNGDGIFKGIADSPKLDIVPNVAEHFAAIVPSKLVINKKFEMQIRAEDKFFNLATGYAGAVTVRDESGKIVAKNVPVSNGMKRIQLKVSTSGPQRFRISDGKLSGRSNPCRVFKKTPEKQIYWGDIHGHTSISDGLGDSSDDYFEFGRDVANLDVCALTDHGHFDWQQNINSVKKFYEPGKYVTLLAQESGAGHDHMNFYFLHDNTDHIKSWPKKYDQLYEILHKQYNTGTPEVITGPHHFTYHRGDDRYPFGIFDTRTARFVEVYSSHGTSEYLGNPRPCAGACDKEKFMQAGLEMGRRFGVIGSSDTHASNPGRSIWGHYKSGLVAFLAKELTREAIWNALWNYDVYATSFDRIYVEFTINGQEMGEEITAKGKCKIKYYVIGKTDNIKVFLIHNNKECRVDSSKTGLVEIDFEHTPAKGNNFYYLRVVQDNGERAWSTPIWVHNDILR